MLFAIIRLRLRYSLFRVLIPLFDRLFPTKPMRVHQHLRILILNWRDPKHPRAGGAETYLHEIAKRWVAAGHCVEWLTAGFAGSTRHDVVDGVKITRVGNRATVYAAVPIEYLRNYRDSFDVIVDAENGIPFFSPLYSLKPKILLMFHVHRTVFLKHMPPGVGHSFAFFETKVMPLIYRAVPFVAISSDTKAEVVAQRMTALPINVVQSGVDSACSPGRKEERPTIVYIGRLQRYKRVELLIAAMPEVLEKIKDAQLVIAGTGDESVKLRKLAGELGVGDSVVFRGFVNEEAKRSLLASAWIFASPSSMEGWGITAAEALASGTPAVVFDVPGLREIVKDGESGCVLPEGANLASVLVRVLSDAEYRRRLSAGALARGRDFSWDQAAENMLDILMNLGAEPHRLVRRGDRWHLITRPIARDRGLGTVSRLSVVEQAVLSDPLSLPERVDSPA
jgi:glycosyltransferase involved in cell wall biosynthesis